MLDLGCGTGWCGREVKPWARTLTGVDLSDGMLGYARRSGVYDRMHRAELTAFLEKARGRWDVITIADTLCYFGALEPVFQAATPRLSAKGVLVFTVEAMPDDSIGGHALQHHGRYCHAEAYVRETLLAAGLTVVALRRETLRLELGAEVAGLVVAASPKG